MLLARLMCCPLKIVLLARLMCCPLKTALLARLVCPLETVLLARLMCCPLETVLLARLLLRLFVARHPGLAFVLAVGSPSRERAGEVVGVPVVVQHACAGVLLEWEARHGPGKMIVAEAPAQHREREGERRGREKKNRDG
jgi:hypothetical protein